MRIIEITEVNLSAFVYRLFYEDFSSIDGHKALHWALEIPRVIPEQIWIICVYYFDIACIPSDNVSFICSFISVFVSCSREEKEVMCNAKEHKLDFTKITEVNLSEFVYRLFHEDFSPIVGTNLDGTGPFPCLIYI